MTIWRTCRDYCSYIQRLSSSAPLTNTHYF